ncbi:MAG: hypothetical protein V1735_05875 [Nanoarchaeota archaeon]
MEKHDIAPIFVKIDEYKEIIEIMNQIKAKLAEGKSILAGIEEIKTQEENELEQWRSELEEVQRKMTFIDKTLFEPEA